MKTVDWKELTFGVEIEFVGGAPEQVELLPGWIMDLNERQTDDTGDESGSELKPPPLVWGRGNRSGKCLPGFKSQEPGPTGTADCMFMSD
ncbi:amidoligase family protein [Paenibacillus sp. P26]|nr:amidoligase family protein [Paenibacillus sp. P26]